jgi:hypothetical protein
VLDVPYVFSTVEAIEKENFPLDTSGIPTDISKPAVTVTPLV